MPHEINDQDFRTFIRLQDIASKYDGPEGLVRKIDKLEKDNGTYRDTIRDLEAKVPAEGMVVIPKADGDELAEYRKLGKVDELKTVAVERDDLKKTVAEQQREKAFRSLVKAAGLPEEAVETLLDMKTLEGATVEVKKEKDGAKEIEVPYVTLAGENQKPQKFAEFAAASPQLKGLRMEPAKPGTDSSRRAPPFAGSGSSTEREATQQDQTKAVRSHVDYTV